MASAREMRLRIKSVRNISQVTRALEAVSAAKVRKAIQALNATRAYAAKAWQVLTHITNQPESLNLYLLPSCLSRVCASGSPRRLHQRISLDRHLV